MYKTWRNGINIIILFFEYVCEFLLIEFPLIGFT